MIGTAAEGNRRYTAQSGDWKRRVWSPLRGNPTTRQSRMPSIHPQTLAIAVSRASRLSGAGFAQGV
jgi:hypothetical protein